MQSLISLCSHLLMFSVTCQESAPFLVLAKSVINSHLRSRFPTIASYRHFKVHPRLLWYCEMPVVFTLSTEQLHLKYSVRTLWVFKSNVYTFIYNFT